jgi:hypothetical protein
VGPFFYWLPFSFWLLGPFFCTRERELSSFIFSFSLCSSHYLFVSSSYLYLTPPNAQARKRESQWKREARGSGFYLFSSFLGGPKESEGETSIFCSWKLREESCCCVQKWTNQRERGVPVSVEKQWRRSASDRKGCTSIYISFNGGDCMDHTIHTHPTAGAATWAASCDETWQIGRAARGVGWPQRREK